MKKILFLAILFISLNAFAQGNLQFNRVRTFQGVLNCSKINILLDTVPQGKVWKIQSMGPSYTDCLTINNIPYVNIYRGETIGSSSSNGSYYGFTHINETPWLKAGDILGWSGNSLQTPCNYAWGQGASTTYNITAIEYNIIP